MKGMQKILSLAIVLVLLLTMAVGCTPASETPDTSDTPNTPNTPNTPADLQEQPAPEGDNGGALSDPDDPTVTVTLNGSGYSVSKSGVVTAAGNVLTITEPGTYKLSGTLDNAQLRILVEKTEIVNLILAGVSITNSVSAPLYIESADKVFIELAEGTENVLTDAQVYVFPEGEDKPNACLYSSEDLTFRGTGSLNVNARYNNGIGTKNDLKILGGKITVTAVNNALKGNQSVKIEGGELTLTGADGIKSDSLTEGEGVIRILGGKVTITAGDDGLQAVTDITVAEGATVSVKAADKDVNCDGTTNIAHGALTSQ